MNTNKIKAYKKSKFEAKIEMRKQNEGLKQYETPEHNCKVLQEALPHNCIAALELRKSGYLGSKQYWKDIKAFCKKEIENSYNHRPSFFWCRQMVEMGNRVFEKKYYD
jgi:hypothetical protein